MCVCVDVRVRVGVCVCVCGCVLGSGLVTQASFSMFCLWFLFCVQQFVDIKMSILEVVQDNCVTGSLQVGGVSDSKVVSCTAIVRCQDVLCISYIL